MKRFKLITFLLLVALLWFGLTSGIGLYIDLLWFDSVGYLQVFNRTLGSKFLFWLLGMAVSFLFLGLNFWLASRRSLGSFWLREDLMALARRGANGLFWLVILAVSFLLGLVTLGQWLNFLQYLHQGSAGVTDPIFEKDLSFYFFSLPILSFLSTLGLTLILFAVAICATSYLIHGHIGYFRRLQLTPAARVHLLLLLAAGFLVLAGRFWLNRFDLLYSRRGAIFGAAYADLHAQLPAYWILAGLSLLTALLFLLSIAGRTIRLAAISAVVFALAYIGANSVYPALVQNLIVKPNELQKEQPYIAHNIQYTSQAYNLDQIEVKEFAADEALTMEGLGRHPSTLRNIRLWDWRPLKDCYNQLQSIRPYYDFHDIDLDRYVIDGNYRQVMLATRELDFSKIAEQAQSWINQFFQYTHGYGLCMSPVNEVTSEGLPEFFIKDIPPRSSVDLQIERPEIYFGEKTDSAVFVRTAMQEFDYPIGDQNALTTYQEERGIAIGSFLRRLLFAWELRSYEILLTENFRLDSRILMYRRLRDRVPKIAPFLLYDSDPYLVIDEGRLFWMQDAYTVSDRYPYSEPYQGRFNYIRNSVKVVVDAYLGDVTYYIADSRDPLIQVYSRIFPELFRPLETMPKGLRDHIRYPEDFFNVQRDMFRTYHMRDSRVFYNKEDLWEIPNEIYAGNEQLMESYYVIMSLPGSQREEFVLLIPFTPRNKNNMIAWLAARADGEHYGKLILYQFPKQKLTYGPMQVEARIDQDPNISQLITLWSQKGSRVIRGNLLVIPVEQSLLYVEPLYLQAEKSEIPELTRIIVVHGNRVSMEESLAAAAETALGGVPRVAAAETVPSQVGQLPAQPSSQDTSAELLARALEHYRRSQEHLKQGHWAAYGEEQRKLGEVLRQLSEQRR